jgi:hypothetical protein
MTVCCNTFSKLAENPFLLSKQELLAQALPWLWPLLMLQSWVFESDAALKAQSAVEKSLF